MKMRKYLFHYLQDMPFTFLLLPICRPKVKNKVKLSCFVACFHMNDWLEKCQRMKPVISFSNQQQQQEKKTSPA